MLEPGSVVPARLLTSVTSVTHLAAGAASASASASASVSASVSVPDPERLVHLQFRRFAGCPVCHLHLRSVVRRHAEIEAAGIREVVLFHSSAEELRPHVADFPFAVIADPRQRLYREFGVESSPRSLLDPRAWGPVLWAIARSAAEVVRGRERLPAPRQPNGRLGLPADLLIGPDGGVLAAKYGEHVYDQWSVDELLRLAAARYPVGAAGTSA
ncbi:peroxiredoxin-like family protein [Streptomyces sp. NBC_01244]|uniref:peroxiredoxin-like family protein n=1 Tax=Streptomyces sp. NBC_01244 TaxID=2903797 RepID=UPI002E0EA55F|nr:AhpC/TSA family protein [Streptomyces sp. NBC_01244]